MALLTHQGEISPLNIKIRGLYAQGGIVAISRQKCVFASFKAPEGTRGGAALAAARVFAANGSPFKDSGVLISRQTDRFGIWWWDKAWVDQALTSLGRSGNPTIIPEPFFRQAGKGPQIVRSGTGYACQVWDRDFLLSDQWMRTPPDSDSWGDFLRSGGHDRADLPTVSASPFVSANPYLGSLISSYSAEALGQVAAGAAFMILTSVTLFFLGQSLGYYFEDRGLRSQIAAASSHSQIRADEYKAQVRELSALKRELDQPQPLSMLQAAQTILSPFGYKLSRFAFDDKQASFELPAEASIGVDLLAEELEASPYFSHVEPVLDRARKKLVFTMAIDAPIVKASAQGPK